MPSQARVVPGSGRRRGVTHAGGGVVLASLLLCLAPLSSTPAAAQDDGTTASPLTLGLVDDSTLVGMGRIGGLKDVAAGDSVLVTLAECEEGDCTEVARSDDGTSWEITPGVLAGYPVDLGWSEAGFVALTIDGSGRRVSAYHSTDGRTWQRSRLGNLGPGPVLAIGPDGYLAFGCEGAGCYLEEYGTRRPQQATTTVWSSADGSDWSREAPEVIQGTVLLDAATSLDTAVAIGRATDAAEAGAVFAHVNGDWLPLELPLPQGRDGERINLIDVASLPGGGFAITGELLPGGFEPLGDPFLLTSPDGVAWELDEGFLELEDPNVQVFLQSPAEGSDDLVASLALELDLGSARSAIDSPVLVWSVDGREWSTEKIPARRGMRAYIDDLALTQEGRVVLVGSLEGRGSERSAMWIGDDEPDEGSADPGTADERQAADRPSTSFTRAERVLLEAVPPDIVDTCVPRRTDLPDGNVAAVQCKPASPIVRDMAYYLLEGDDARAVFDERMREHKVPEGFSQKCRRGKPAYEYATGGLDADGCYIDDNGRANLRSISWITNCRVLRAGSVLLKEPSLYVAVLGEDADIARLSDWSEQGLSRPIERPDAAFSPACPS